MPYFYKIMMLSSKIMMVIYATKHQVVDFQAHELPALLNIDGLTKKRVDAPCFSICTKITPIDITDSPQPYAISAFLQGQAEMADVVRTAAKQMRMNPAPVLSVIDFLRTALHD